MGQGGPRSDQGAPFQAKRTISGKEGPVSGQGGPRSAQGAQLQAKRAPCQATGLLVRPSKGVPDQAKWPHFRQTGPHIRPPVPFVGQGGYFRKRARCQARGPISSKEGFVSCNLASFWAKGTPDQAKGPYFRQLGPLVRPRGPLSRQAGSQIRPRGPMSGKEGTVSGNVTPCRSRGPQIRPRGGTPFQAKRAPCQAKGAQYSGQGSPQISPRDSISGKEGTASGHTKLLVWPKGALDQTTGHFFLFNGGHRSGQSIFKQRGPRVRLRPRVVHRKPRRGGPLGLTVGPLNLTGRPLGLTGPPLA